MLDILSATRMKEKEEEKKKGKLLSRMPSSKKDTVAPSATITHTHIYMRVSMHKTYFESV